MIGDEVRAEDGIAIKGNNNQTTNIINNYHLNNSNISDIITLLINEVTKAREDERQQQQQNAIEKEKFYKDTLIICYERIERLENKIRNINSEDGNNSNKYIENDYSPPNRIPKPIKQNSSDNNNISSDYQSDPLVDAGIRVREIARRHLGIAYQDGDPDKIEFWKKIIENSIFDANAMPYVQSIGYNSINYDADEAAKYEYIARISWSQERYEDAEKNYLRAYAALSRRYPDGHPRLRACRDELNRLRQMLLRQPITP